MKNQINIDKNYGKITVADAQGVEIVINTQDAADIVAKLEALQNAQLDDLLQAMDKQTADVLKLFKTLLNGVTAQKNIVKGSISNIGGDVHIGDVTVRQDNSGGGDNVGRDKIVYNTTLSPILPKLYILSNESISEENGKNEPIEILERQYLLEQFQTLIDKGNRYIVLHGDKGIGKTTFLSIYYNTFSKGKYEQYGWFIFQNTLYETYVAALTKEGLHKDEKIDDWEGFYYHEAMRHVRDLRNFRNAENQPTKKIMVIDNVPNEAAIVPYYHNLLHLENTVFIFITETAFADERFVSYSLPRLTDEEVKSILSKFFSKKEQLEYADLIQGNAFLLQLFLKQAPRNAERKVQHYSNNILQNLNPNITTRDQQITETLYRLDKFTALQEWILIQFAALPNLAYDAEMIYEYLFPDTLKEDEEELDITIEDIITLKSYLNYQKTRQDIGETFDDFETALETLAQKGWLIEKEGEYELSDLSRAVFAFQQKNQVDFTLELADCLIINFFTLQHGNLKDHLQYINHLIHYIEFIHPVSHPVYLTTLYKLITWYQESGKYYAELDYRKLHFDLAQQYYGINSDATIENETDLAWNYRITGDLKKAKQHGENALNKAYQFLDKKAPLTGKCEGHLGLILQTLGEYGGAEVLLEKAMISAEANFGEKHSTTAVCYSNLATVLKDLGDYSGAKVLLEKAMISDEANFGEKHPNTARTYSNLALVLQDLGEYSGAKVLLEKAMFSDEANFGEKHPNTAQKYSNLGIVLQALRDYSGAKVLLEKAMRSDEANFGENHPTTAVRYSNLSALYLILEDEENAFLYIQKTCTVFIQRLGIDHPNTKNALMSSNVIKLILRVKGWTEAEIQALLQR